MRDMAKNILFPIEDDHEILASDGVGVAGILAGLDIEGGNSDASDEPEQNALEDLCDCAEDVADLFDQQKAEHSQPQHSKSSGSRAKSKTQPESEPAASSSSRPPGPSMLSKPDSEIKPKPKPKSADEAGTDKDKAAVSRKKEVVEEVLVVPGYGKIHFNTKSMALTAHCDCINHGSHVCRKQRTSQGAARVTLKNIGQGRPLGFLTAWLMEQDEYEDQSSHVRAPAHVFTYQKRCKARAHLKTIPGAAQFFAFEREKAGGEESEPECIS